MSPAETAIAAANVDSTIRDEISGASAALKKIGWSILIAISAALANLIPDLVPVIRDIVIAHLPIFLQTWGGTMVTSGALALVAILNGFAKSDTKKAVATAYVSEPDEKTASDIKKLYGK